MHPLIEQHQNQLQDLCREFHVEKLEIFGSATDSRFNDETSDLDFLVSFKEMEPGQYADAYFNLLEALQQLFQRNIDLVVESAVRNPYFLDDIRATRSPLYE